MRKKPLVWSVGGTDNTNGAGVGSDILTGHDFGVHVFTFITAHISQNHSAVLDISELSPSVIVAQWEALQQTGAPEVIKLGVLGSAKNIETLLSCLEKTSATLIWDPVLGSSSGTNFFSNEALEIVKRNFLPKVTLLTPNIAEAEYLVGHEVHTPEEVKHAACELLNYGVRAVLIKGGHLSDYRGWDYFATHDTAFWLKPSWVEDLTVRGTGCAYAMAVASALALGYGLEDSIVLGKMYLSQGIRHAYWGKGAYCLGRKGFPSQAVDLPALQKEVCSVVEAPFPRKSNIGFYPIVDSADWVTYLAERGVKTIQIRIKSPTEQTRREILRSILIAKNAGVSLFVNDHWQWAIDYNATGVHLGQSDLKTANVRAVQRAGLLLGVSTHSIAELAQANAYAPSYVAFGPIYATVNYSAMAVPQGLDKLRYWKTISPYPVVAIGGIQETRIAEVLGTGVTNLAVISALRDVPHPETMVTQFLEKMRQADLL